MNWPDVVLLIYMCLWIVLAVHGAHRLWLLVLYRGERPGPTPELAPQNWPVVTIQLPIFNEYHVVERLIAAATSVRAPKGKLEIQILDDSTDETATLTRKLVTKYQSRGHDIHWLRRGNRVGFKAGALEAGLEVCRGELVAVFDADFVPTADFLEKTVPWLVNGYGMVQARWSHINLEQSWLTQVQGTLLDGHFVVEHAARCYGGRWFNFNGTAGIWRKEVIEDAGGWQHDTLTEDLDLSYRAQLRGHRFLFLEDVLAPSELPSSIAAFKAQQHRWARGSVQTAKKLLGSIWRAPVSLRHKVEATFHLTGNVGHPAVLCLALLVPWAIVSRMESTVAITGWIDLLLFSCATFSLFLFYGVAILYSGHGKALSRWLAMPFVMAAAIGISISQTRAVLEGLFAGTGVFVRTPKWGTHKNSKYRSKVHWTVWLECSVAVYLWASFAWVSANGWWLSLPFLGLFATGYTVIGFGSVFERYVGSSERQRGVSKLVAIRKGIQVAHQSHAGAIHSPSDESPRRTA